MGSAADSPRHSADADDGDNGSSKGRNGIAPQQAKKSGQAFSANVFEASFWRKFWVLSKPFWARPLRAFAWFLLVALLAQIFTTTWLLVKLNFQQGEFFSALSNKEEERFWNAVLLYAFIIATAIPVLALKEYTLQRLCLLWRAWMTEDLMSRYLVHERAFFRLAGEQGCPHSEGEVLESIDNPDQRIVSDVDSFTNAALNFTVVFLGAGLRVASFGKILYDISTHLALFTIVYAVVMTGAVTWLFGKRLAVLKFIALKCEADLRFALVRVRENAESIAMFSGTLPAVLVAPQYLAGQVEFGVVKQAQDAFMMLRYSLFVIANRTDEFSAFATGLDRLDALVQAIHANDPPAIAEVSYAFATDGGAGVPRSGPDGAEMKTMHSNEQHEVTDLSVCLTPGQSLLIMGPSGAGKTSLLRVLSGLWAPASGTVYGESAAPGARFFLPQRVYMPQGTLADCLLYPASGGEEVTQGDQALLLRALEAVGLNRFGTGQLSEEKEWGRMLSPGEQQRLSFARLLLRRWTSAAFLDEATSALDVVAEGRLYALLPSLCGVFISVGHRESLVQHHTHVLSINGERSSGEDGAAGGWALQTRQEYLASRPYGVATGVTGGPGGEPAIGHGGETDAARTEKGWGWGWRNSEVRKRSPR